MEGLQYKALPPELTETLSHASVVQKCIVSGRVTEAGLRSLLGRLYAEVSRMGGFQRFEHPDSIQIMLFTNEEDATSNMALWIAMLCDWDGPAKIQINEAKLKDLNAPPQPRMGLSDEHRRKIFWEACIASNRAYAETDVLCPLKGNFGSEAERIAFVHRMGKTFRGLESRYHADVANKYGITPAQVEEIMEEGTAKSWSFPVPGPAPQ
jgi:hypothetical protein